MTPEPKPSGPLSGLRVIDLTTVLMGPYATQVLADYGANVIKVEPPGGDIMRWAGEARTPGMGPVFLQANRSKRSIVLDIKREEGRCALLRLCEAADVLIHNIRPAAMRRLRLSYDDVREANPRLIYVSLFGYGEDGPYAGRPAYDDLIQGLAAIPALAAQAGASAPRYAPLVVADAVCGLNAVHAVLAAVIHRDRSGEGQAVDLPMFETMAQFVLLEHMGGRTFDPPLGPAGYSRLLAADRRPYRTRDGYLCVLVYTDKQWTSFFRATGNAALVSDPRFKDQAARSRHYGEIYGWLAEVLTTRTTAEWTALLQEADIPCAPMHDLDALIDDPHLAAVGLIQRLEHPTEGTLNIVGAPGRWSRTPPSPLRPPPGLGVHSREILREAGLSEEEIENLIALNVVDAAQDAQTGSTGTSK